MLDPRPVGSLGEQIGPELIVETYKDYESKQYTDSPSTTETTPRSWRLCGGPGPGVGEGEGLIGAEVGAEGVGDVCSVTYTLCAVAVWTIEREAIQKDSFTVRQCDNAY